MSAQMQLPNLLKAFPIKVRRGLWHEHASGAHLCSGSGWLRARLKDSCGQLGGDKLVRFRHLEISTMGCDKTIVEPAAAGVESAAATSLDPAA